MAHRFKLGRQPRTHDPRFPHMSAIMAGRRPLVMPPPIDWSAPMPDDLGMMLNDELGDCTIAAIYHLIQLWSFHVSDAMLTEPDALVLKMYEKIDGYVAGDPSTDQGGIMQHVMKYWMRKGVAMANGVNKALAVVEVDPQNDIDVANAINDCAAVNIGFDVPAYLMPEDANPPLVWDINPNADNTIIGGHDVIGPGFNGSMTLNVISWGSKAYQMTKAFRDKFVTEMYAIADPQWINVKGTTPGGLTLTQLEQQMKALKA